MQKSKWEIFLVIGGGVFLFILLLISFWGISFLASNLAQALDAEIDQKEEPIRFDLAGFYNLNLLPQPMETNQEAETGQE